MEKGKQGKVIDDDGGAEDASGEWMSWTIHNGPPIVTNTNMRHAKRHIDIHTPGR